MRAKERKSREERSLLIHGLERRARNLVQIPIPKVCAHLEFGQLGRGAGQSRFQSLDPAGVHDESVFGRVSVRAFDSRHVLLA